MKRYIKSSLNLDLWNVQVSSINGGRGKSLDQKLKELLTKVPVGRYILALGERGYNTGYYKVDAENIKWLYDNELHKISGYWDTDLSFCVLPSNFKPSTKINYEDDMVYVYEISDSDKKIYSGLEDYEPMKREYWTYCEDLGMYYLIDYMDKKIYVKWSVD